MLYEFGESLKQIELSQIDASRITAGIIPLDALKASNGTLFHFDPDDITACEQPDTYFRTTIKQTQDSMFCILSLREINNVLGARDRVGLFVKKNLLLLVSIMDKDNSIETAFLDAAALINPANASLEHIICAFFERLYYQDSTYLEAYENTVARLEEQIEKGVTGKNFNSQILSLRRKLLVVRNYYEQLLELAETMEENEFELFQRDKLHHFRNMQCKLTRLLNNTQLLRDSLIQVREAYQAALALSENQIMKMFTVVTTIFLPLTLLVGWFGMNFKYMPELYTKWGYPAVIVLSVVIVVGCIWFFRRKKLL